MTIASLLLAFLPSVAVPCERFDVRSLSCSTSTPSGAARASKVRPAVEQLIRDGYPIKRIDIDRRPRPRERGITSKACPTFIVVDASGRELGPHSRDFSPRPTSHGSTRPPPPRRGRRPTPTLTSVRRENLDPEPATTMTTIDAGSKGPHAMTTAIARKTSPERAEPVFTNPKPWETVVRIRVHQHPFDGLRLGHDHPQYARGVADSHLRHIFKLDGRKQAQPSQFPRRIMIDLFDGKLQGTRPGQGPLPGIGRGQGGRLRLHAGCRADPDPAGPAAAGLPGRAGALGAPGAHEGPHGRLLRRATTRRSGTRSSSGRGS